MNNVLFLKLNNVELAFINPCKGCWSKSIKHSIMWSCKYAEVNLYKTALCCEIYCTWRAKTCCQIMITCHSKLTRTKSTCELFTTCHPNMTNVKIAFVFLFTGKQKSGCRQLQVFNHRWYCCMFAFKSYFMLVWCNLV